jgi:hypothetical protein
MIRGVGVTPASSFMTATSHESGVRSRRSRVDRQQSTIQNRCGLSLVPPRRVTRHCLRRADSTTKPGACLPYTRDRGGRASEELPDSVLITGAFRNNIEG